MLCEYPLYTQTSTPAPMSHLLHLIKKECCWSDCKMSWKSFSKQLPQRTVRGFGCRRQHIAGGRPGSGRLPAVMQLLPPQIWNEPIRERIAGIRKLCEP